MLVFPSSMAGFSNALITIVTARTILLQVCRRGSLTFGTTDSASPIRLISSNGLKADFAALSHCWGGVTPLTATKATLASRMRQIEMSELPKTFQEVVQIVRRLNLRYLWIDTLCIIQDDPKDWMQESADMCHVYRDACYVHHYRSKRSRRLYRGPHSPLRT